jgi:hypothetical protein
MMQTSVSFKDIQYPRMFVEEVQFNPILMGMKTIQGCVIKKTESNVEAGRFTLLLACATTGKIISCMASAIFTGQKPNTGDQVVLKGEYKKDMTYFRTKDFVFDSISILTGTEKIGK